MKVLSLFDGISCGRVALERAGFEVETYYASEIDKYATQVSESNYPDIIRMGDVTKWKEWDIDWSEIDLIMAGSPCQGFSMAGKQLAFNDPRSALFFEFVNILNHIKKHNPKVKFLLENVKMKQQHMDIISGLLDEYPVMINSALLSAQNRNRLYWANWDFTQPSHGKDEILENILQSDDVINDKYFLSEEQISKIDFTNINKEFKTDIKILGHRKGFRRNTQCFDPSGKTECLDTCTGGGRQPHVIKINKKGGIKQNQDKASCLTGGAHSGGNHSDMDLLVKGCAQRGRYNPDGSTSQKIEVRNDDKSNCLTSVQKDSMILKDFSIRRLTPVECERLQTLPDNYTEGVSDTQRYKALGNGWTVDVIAHILKSMGE